MDEYLVKFHLLRLEAEARMSGGAVPEAFVPILRVQDASLPRAYKTPVLACVRGCSGVAAAGSQISCLVGPTGARVRQDALPAKGNEETSQSSSDAEDYEAWVAYCKKKKKLPEEEKRGG